MQYEGKLYGKIPAGYIPLTETTQEVDAMRDRIKTLEDMLNEMNKMLTRASMYVPNASFQWLKEDIKKVNNQALELLNKKSL